DNFPTGAPTSKVDNIRVAASTDAAKGVVYLDCIGFNLLTYASRSINPEKLIPRQAIPYLDEKRFPKLATLSEAEVEGLRKLKGPPAKPRKAPGITEAKVNDLLAKIKELGVSRDEHGVHGPGLDGSANYCAAPGEYGGKDIRFWPDEHGPDGL